MPLTIPESLADCLYFTNRGYVIAWVYRQACPKCKEGRLGKPIVKGKVQSKAKEYVCHSCGYREDEATHEAGVKLEASYTCPQCNKKGESTGEYKRKKFKGIPSYIVVCQHCGEKMPLTKKLKGVGKKEGPEA